MFQIRKGASLLSIQIDTTTDLTSCAGGRHTMPPPQGWQAAARSGRWRRHCCRPYKLSSDLNSQPKRPGDLDLWPFALKVVPESRVMWATSVPILGLSVLDLGPMYATDRRQTDVRR